MSRAYEIITDRIITKLEAGVVPWCKPWYGKAGMPKNLVSGKQYRGINVFMLHCLAYESPRRSHRRSFGTITPQQ